MDSTFDHYFRSVYGSRWEELKASIAKPVTKVGIHFDGSDPSEIQIQVQLGSSDPVGISVVIPKSENETKESKNVYWMDAASLFPVLALNPQSGSHADFCAAPGGKSLVAFRIHGKDFFGNFFDLSKDRLKRLKSVFYDLLGEEVTVRQKIKAMDAAKLGRLYPDQFQTVLLDAPCSGERHMLKTSGRVEEWKESYSKSLGKRQYALLCSALDATEPGGRLVYSTCSLSPYENDEVIKRLLKRRKDEAELIPPQDIKLSIGGESIGEMTETGILILPDTSTFGPIFFSVLKKSRS